MPRKLPRIPKLTFTEVCYTQRTNWSTREFECDQDSRLMLRRHQGLLKKKRKTERVMFDQYFIRGTIISSQSLHRVYTRLMKRRARRVKTK